MKKVRIIPCLDVKDGRVVKGVAFVDLRDAGDIVECARAYDKTGADELALLDIAATNEGRKTFVEVVKRVAGAINIPLAVGGGIGSVEDFAKLFEAGASKVSMNSAALRDPGLIDEAAKKFGSERVIVAIDAKDSEVVTHGGQKKTGVDAIAWAKEVAARGAGEILLTSMDRDGRKDGYDTALTRAVSEAAGVPVIASGGAGCLEDFHKAVVEGKASAVLAASLFHFGELTVEQVRAYLREKGVLN